MTFINVLNTIQQIALYNSFNPLYINTLTKKRLLTKLNNPTPQYKTTFTKLHYYTAAPSKKLTNSSYKFN